MTSGSASKRRPASGKPRRASARVVTLEAVVDPPHQGPGYAPGPAEFAQIMGVTERTLRTWHGYGLPHQKAADGGVSYPFPDSYLWARCWRHRMKFGYRAAPLALDTAEAWELEEQRAEFPGWYVVVPLDRTHPMREAQLRKAAAGRVFKDYRVVEVDADGEEVEG